jgi:hypothetical protein
MVYNLVQLVIKLIISLSSEISASCQWKSEKDIFIKVDD